MKRSPSFLVIVVVALVGAFALVAVRAGAQPSKPTPQHKIVFELTSDSSEAWEGLLNNVENVQKSLGKDKTQIEVVGHGKGLNLLVAAKDSAVRDRLKSLSDAGGVTFAACENTMRKTGVKKDELVPFATPVDSGVGEIVRKQEAGFSYLRTGG